MQLFTQYQERDVNEAYQELKSKADEIQRPQETPNGEFLLRPPVLSRQITEHRDDGVDIANEVVHTANVIISNALSNLAISQDKADCLRAALKDATENIKIYSEDELKGEVLAKLIEAEINYDALKPDEEGTHPTNMGFK